MIQYAALVSLDWFENMDRHMQHPFYQFAFGCMTRAKKVTFENLRLRILEKAKKRIAYLQCIGWTKGKDLDQCQH